MKFIIVGRNIDVTEGLKSAVEDKIGRLEKYFHPDTEVHVTLSVEKDRQKIEVTISVKGSIIRSDVTRKFVVPSAPGKRNSKDTKVTDMLYDCYALADADEDFRIPLMKIKDRYDSIINGLNLKLSLEEEFKVISENFKNKAGADYAASRGEFLNGISRFPPAHRRRSCRYIRHRRLPGQDRCGTPGQNSLL